MDRRTFLELGMKFVGGAFVAGASSNPDTAQPREEQLPSPSEEVHEGSYDTDSPLPDTIETIETNERVVDTVTPRTSAALEQRISAHMEALLREGEGSFGARQVFRRALDLKYNDEPLIDLVYETFDERLNALPTLQTMDIRSRNWMLEVCCYGEVTAESSWNRMTIGADNDQGLWQITDLAATQIAIERANPGQRTQLDRFDPVDATRGAAEYFDFTLRSLTPWIDKKPGEQSINPNDSEELNIFNLANETEFIIPLIITGYKCGPEPLKTALSAFYRSNPDTSLVGLDVFFSFIDYIRNNPVPKISESTLDYFMKCLALKRIFDAFEPEE